MPYKTLKHTTIKGLFFVVLFGLCVNWQTAKAQEPLEPLAPCIEELLRNYWVETGHEEISGYLSLKDTCVEYKNEATQCCSNPSACSGLTRDIIQHALPLAPAIYGAYQGFRTSQKMNSNKISREEAANKMCDIKNKTNMAGFLSQLLLQMGTMIQTTCADRIKTCQSQCNSAIQEFRDKMKKCFSQGPYFHKTPNKVEDMIQLAEQYFLIGEQDRGLTVENQDQARNGNPDWTCDPLNSTHLCVDLDGQLISYVMGTDQGCKCGASEESPCSCNDCTDSVTTCSTQLLPTQPLRYLILLGRAYKNSSEIKDFKTMKTLSEKSDESHIVKCSHQPNRVADNQPGPTGGPIPSEGLIDICQQVVPELVERPEWNPPPPTTPRQTPQPHTGTFTGTTHNAPPDTGQKGVVDLNSPLDPGSDDDLSLNKNPSLSENLPSFGGSVAGGSPSGGGGGGAPGGLGGGGGGGSGGGATGSAEGEEEDQGPVWGTDTEGSGASFAGGDASKAGGKKRSPSGGRTIITSRGKDKKNDKKPKRAKKAGAGSGSPSPIGKSIFDIAGSRIRQFCADYHCKP